jgi:hypothetical protein
VAIRRRIERRLSYLWTFELVGAAAWTMVAVLWWARAGVRWPSAIGLVLALFLLAQGSVYWFAKLRAVRRQPFVDDRRLLATFRRLRVVNRGLLAATLVAGVVSAFVWGTQGAAGDDDVLRWLDLFLAGVLWTLALLEYVNYFHRQLMYDSPSELRWWLRHRRLKTSWLARDLAASEPPLAPPVPASRRTPPRSP